MNLELASKKINGKRTYFLSYAHRQLHVDGMGDSADSVGIPKWVEADVAELSRDVKEMRRWRVLTQYAATAMPPVAKNEYVSNNAFRFPNKTPASNSGTISDSHSLNVDWDL